MLEVWLSSYLPRAMAAAEKRDRALLSRREPSPLTYAVVTPVRNEADNIGRLASALAAQRFCPTAWTIVDTGSTDETGAIVAELAREHSWIRLFVARATWRSSAAARSRERSRPACTSLDEAPDVVVKLDADVSFDPDYFERLLGRFAAEPDARDGQRHLHRGERRRVA